MPSEKQKQGTPEVGRMLRVIGLALLLVVGVAVPSAANDEHVRKGPASVAHQHAAIGEARSSVQGSTVPRLIGIFTGAPSPARGTSSAGLRSELVTRTATLAALAPERRERGRSLALPWIRQGKSGLRLPVTERLSFAVGYRHLEPEDLSRRYGEAGSVDYDSHDFLLRAHWRY
jgi:hypothetical protein